MNQRLDREKSNDLPETSRGPATRFARTRRVLHFLGIDQAVGFTLIGNIWNAVSGPVLLILIVRKLTDSERGVLFNYVDITTFQIFCELGIATVLQQLASRERAFLMIGPDGTLTGDPKAKARMASLFRLAIRWFVAVMLFTNIVLLPVGWLFFEGASIDKESMGIIFKPDPALANVNWQFAWILTVIVSSLFGFGVSLFLFMAGCGDVIPAARMTALQGFISTVGLAVLLIAGFRLLSHPFSGMLGFLVPLGWFLLARRRMLVDLWTTDAGTSRVHWRTDVWPFQWRIALSSISALLLVRLLNPITMKFHGARAAGQLGLSLYILLAIQLMGTLWVGTKVPLFGQLIAHRKWHELDHQFRSVLIRSTGFVALLMGAFVVANAFVYSSWEGSLVQHWGELLFGHEAVASLSRPSGKDDLPQTKSLLEPASLAYLALAILVLHVVNTQAAYLRAHRREPMLWSLVPLGIAVAATLLITARSFDTMQPMIIGYLACVLVIGLGVGNWIFFTRRHQWHQDGSEIA
jgi:hypothetical protein